MIVMLTVCTSKRKRILARDDVYPILLTGWANTGTWLVGRYVILPDHIHLFCSPTERTCPLIRWVKFWRSNVSRVWPRPEEQPIWQTDFWDTQLRCGDSYEAKWEYVCGNPVRHGLVARPEDWPYAGELNLLEWD